MKKLSTFLMVLGLVIIISPSIIKKYEDYKTHRILIELEEYIESLEGMESSTELVSDENSNLIPNEVPYITSDEILNQDNQLENIETEEPITPKKSAQPSIPLSDTLIEIDKINVKLPVFQGVTGKSLKYGIGSFRKDILPGAIGNFSLAGHRSYTYGRMFNRLNELEE